MRKLSIVMVALLGFVGIGVATATPAFAKKGPPGGTLYVNGSSGHDTSACRIATAPCKTISYAITQADAGAQIDVSGGTYAEQVNISGAGLDGLVIVGSGTGNGGTIIEPSTLPVTDTDTDSSQAQATIVDVKGTTGVTLEDLTINGTAAQSSFTPNDCSIPDFVGAYYHDATGTLSNVVVTGVDNPPSDFGCQGGLAIYAASDQGDTASLSMTSVTVTDFDKNGITCDDPGTTCSINSSTVTGDGPIGTVAQNDVQVYGASATMSNDTISDVSYNGGTYDATAVLVINAGTFSMTSSNVSNSDVAAYLLEDSAFALQNGTTEGAWSVTKNTVMTDPNNGGGSPGEGFGDGIDVDSTTAPVTVNTNTVNSNAGFGISLYGAAGATVQKNKVSGNDNGIFLGGGSVASGATNNSIIKNTVSSNTNDGILVQSGSSGNTFTSNKLNNNSNWDAQDQSTGAGTSGTGNTWHKNKCTPAHDSQPLGLC